VAAIAEFERDCLLERQREGIALAKKEDKYRGRKRVPTPDNWEEVYYLWKHREISRVEAMKRTRLANATFYRLVKRWDKQVGSL